MKVNKEFWERKNVLVTGGTGLVGSHIVEELINLNANIIVPYIELNPKSYFLTKGFDKKVTLVPCDIKDKEKVFDLISKYEIEIILHLAAQPIVTIGLVNPYETLHTNIMGTVNVLEAGRTFPNIKSMVMASSDKAYGKSDKLPYVESYELKGEGPYDVSKSCMDLICNSYFKCYNLPLVVARFGNIYGPGDLNFNRLVPGIMISLLNKNTFDVRSDGKMVREYVYVKDVAQGYLLLAENIEKVKGESFNFGSGERMDVSEVINRTSNILGLKVDYKILGTAKNEIPAQYLCYDKIKDSLGWEPKFSFEEGIKSTFQWYKEVFGNK